MTTGKVVLVPFPFDDLTNSKVRPAVCLTEPIGEHRHAVLAFISSQILRPEPTDIILDVNREGFSETGLKVSSILRLHRLVTLTTSLIQREPGYLSPSMRREVSAKLLLLFRIRPEAVS